MAKSDTFEQLVKLEIGSQGAYRSVPANLSTEMAAACAVFERKLALLQRQIDEAKPRRPGGVHEPERGWGDWA